MTNSLNTIFDNMDRWRHLPAYQLERRADIFFSAYLPVEQVIDFETFAVHIERHGDPVSKRFAASLRRWTTRAGSTSPA